MSWRQILERSEPSAATRGQPGRAGCLPLKLTSHKWLRTYEKCVDRFLAPSQFVKDKLTENGWDGERIDVLQHFQLIPGSESPSNFELKSPILYSDDCLRKKASLIRNALKMLENVDPVRVPAIFCQLIFYELTWGEKTVDTFCHTFAAICAHKLQPPGPKRSLSAAVATLGSEHFRLTHDTSHKQTHAKRVTRANQFEII